MSESCFNCKKTKFDQKAVSFLCVKTKSGAHKQLTFYFQMCKYFCRHRHSSLISMHKTLELKTKPVLPPDFLLEKMIHKITPPLLQTLMEKVFIQIKIKLIFSFQNLSSFHVIHFMKKALLSGLNQIYYWWYFGHTLLITILN